jgi:drug/metabolite transporter (DMT)-like permease
MNAPSGPRAALIGFAAFLVTAMFWGANIPVTAVLFRTFDPYWMQVWRVSIGALALAAIVAATQGGRALAIPISFGRFVMLGLGISLFLLVYNVGLRYTNAITAAAVMVGSPVYTALFLRAFNGTPFDKGFWVAALLTAIGGTIAVLGRPGAGGQSFALQGGEPLIALSIIFWALYSLGAQKWFEPSETQIRRTYVSTLSAVGCSVVLWGLCRLAGIAGPPNTEPGAEAVAMLVTIAVLATAVGGVTWNIGVSRLGIAAGSLWQNAVPVFAVLISMAFGIHPTGQQILGGVIVMAGVAYMQWRKFLG